MYTPPIEAFGIYLHAHISSTTKITINWKRNIITFKDDFFNNTWRFDMNEKGDIYLYKGVSAIQELDTGMNLMSCWRGAGKHVDGIIRDKIDMILLNDIP